MRSSLAFVRSTGANDSWQVAGGTENVQLRSWAGWFVWHVAFVFRGNKAGDCQNHT